MKVAIIGGAGFIATNLFFFLLKDKNIDITLVDSKLEYFSAIKKVVPTYNGYEVMSFDTEVDYTNVLRNVDIVFHFASTTFPGNSNKDISNELYHNINSTVHLLESCVQCNVGRIVFLSSGGAVYGMEGKCPHSEKDDPFPISSYGIQKLTIEKLLYLYFVQYGLDYRIIRLSNPYGPYQRPDGRLGVISTFIYHALTDNILHLYGNGEVIRDYIYIDDAVEGIKKIAFSNTLCKMYNLGSGKGTSINTIINYLQCSLSSCLSIDRQPSRPIDVPENYLDISRFENEFGHPCRVSLEQGILLTASFMKDYYDMSK